MKKTPIFFHSAPGAVRALVLVLAAALLLALPSLAHAVEGGILRVGVASMVTPVSAVRYYQEIVDYVAAELGIKGEMIHRTTYDEIDRMLEEKSVDLAFICSAPYVIDQEKFGVELLVAPVINGTTFYHSEIIVHKDSPAATFKDLEGKTFAFVDPKSNSGRLYPVFRLARMALTPDTFFSRYFFSYSHNKSVEMVAKKKADGAAVDSVVLAHMRASGSPYANAVKVVHQSPEFGIPPVVIPAGVPLFFKEKLREIFLGMHKSPKGEKILSAMRIERFAVVPDSNYDAIREMRSYIEQEVLTGQNPPGTQPAIEALQIRFGVIPWDNPRIAYEKYQPFLDYLGAKTGARFELALKSTYQEVVNALGSGEFYLALLGPLTYLDAHARFGAVPIAKSLTIDSTPFYQSVIVVGPGSKVAALSQLAGKKFAFSSLWSTSGNLYPRYMLAWEKIHLEKLGSYKNFNYHDTVVKKVLSGEYDAGAVRMNVAKKYAPYGLSVIDSSDPIPTGPVVVSPQAPYAVVKKVQEALLSMAADPEGRAILNKMDPELQGGFIPASDADYSGVRKMINDVPDTCGIGCHPKVNFRP